ncbi:MAG TPA: gluconate 2-dehydrogenase subunit 3 family protein [Rhizomicrobium sp.]|nr:gluconate 2-dehydrogenase subunit 3 family protein [Rhizomicrobium sp.]
MANDAIPRRGFLAGAGAASAGVAALTGGLAAPAPAAAASPQAADPVETWLVLTAEEVAFFSATSDTMIPADELSPSGTQCGVPVFIDRQLASAWGAGARMYRAGPFHQGTPEQGYQLPLTPRDFFAAGVQAANAWSRKTYGKSFDHLTQDQRIEALKVMEEGKAQFQDFDAKAFFQRLLALTMEGFFSDPLYGGNRNKASWRMLGFPGLPATYAGKTEQYRDKRYVAEPQSIQDFS